MKTSLDKIVQYIKHSEKQVIILSGEYPPHVILRSVAEEATGIKMNLDGTLEDKLETFKGKDSEVKAALEFPDGKSRFFCLFSGKSGGRDMLSIKQGILSCLLEFEVKEILIEPVSIMFRYMNKEETEDWLTFKDGLERFFGVSFILIKDDYSLKGRKDVEQQ